MQIIVTVRTGNATMQTWEDVRNATVEALDRASAHFDADQEPRDGQVVGVWDTNGNRVGAVVVAEDR